MCHDLRRIIPILLFIISCCASGEAGFAQSPPEKAITPAAAAASSTDIAAATTAATAFMNGIIGDSAVENLLSLCSLPFCHDDSIILLTTAELRASLKQLLAAAAGDRAKNHPRVDTAYVLDVRKEVLFSMVPINIYFTVVNLKFTVRGQEASKLIILAVQLTDQARVVGIED